MAEVEGTAPGRTLMVTHRLYAPQSPYERSVKVAEDCARHGLALPAEHVAYLLAHCGRVQGAAETADRFWRYVQQGCQLRQDRAFPVPGEVARRARNRIRAALGWPPVLKGERP